MKKLIELKLKLLAKLILLKYKPKIIGITGSVGKTSTKEAVYPVLQKKFRVRKNIKNYNNELGLPLTIINAEAQGKNIFGWFLVFLKAGRLIFFRDRNYPEVLILEMGIDRPGDMDYLLSIARPDVAVMTLVGTVHVEYFIDPAKLHAEKEKLVQAVGTGGWAIFNFDNELTRQSALRHQGRKLTYGLNDAADLRAEEIRFEFEERQGGRAVDGLRYRLVYGQDSAIIKIEHAISLPAVYSTLAAAAVGIAFGLGLEEIAGSLQSYRPPRGRMNLIPGIKNTIILDDTYNAEPDSMKAALDVLRKIPLAGRAQKFAVLGDMLELGAFTEEKHDEIGRLVADYKIDKLIAVGEKARNIRRAAEAAGLPEDSCFHFPFAEEAGKFLEDRLDEGDVVLVKGSQGVRMEKIVKEIMAEPMAAGQLLVRQDKGWLEK